MTVAFACSSSESEPPPAAPNDAGPGLVDAKPPDPTPTDGGADADAATGPTRVVSGRVVFDVYGQNAEGATVRVKDKTATVGSDGRYSIANVPPGPYDLAIDYVSLGNVPSTLLLEGLSKDVVEIALPGLSDAPRRQVALGGSVVPLDATHTVRLMTSSDNRGVATRTLAPGTTTFSGLNYFFRGGGTTAPMTLHALEYRAAPDGSIEQIYGYAKVVRTVTDGAPVADLNLVLSTAFGAGQASVAEDAEADSLFLYHALSNGVGFSIQPADPKVASTLSLWNIPGAAVTLTRARPVTGDAYVSAAVAKPTGAVAFTYPMPVLAVAPLGGAITAATRFEWTKDPLALVCFRMTGSRRFDACGNRTSLELPPGTSLPAGDYQWRVNAYPGSTLEQIVSFADPPLGQFASTGGFTVSVAP
ncbi:MAG: carboxypeptidase regulatory-like domain-containing protein [Deltaproteobacteria bacterium]|nr:carboxypeptidase regulatory-like domain-containing protein [Deltaproteobacteria bacterium]